jgi:hypothetical protein
VGGLDDPRFGRPPTVGNIATPRTPIATEAVADAQTIDLTEDRRSVERRLDYLNLPTA